MTQRKWFTNREECANERASDECEMSAALCRRCEQVIQVNLLTFAITAAGYVRRQESVESDETGFNCK
ncbi:hypothetical protein Y032_0766g2178 [Ancylostoma ceylanicum]|uniref:Uncharacterized protein n=1 Tax=Ancylostoma ceylanicum TaxID=53326 RepID=A0A016WD69_9BILA|nr:hypothetical protein Y032_0766g2178 [Ancylostoma ceylanicum]